MISSFITAALAACLGVWLILPVLRRSGMMDVPNARSSHKSATPRGGGLAVVGAMILGVFAGSFQEHSTSLVVVLGVVALATLGMLDDLSNGLNVGTRLVAQAIVATCTAIAVTAAQWPGGVTTLLVVAGGALWLVTYTNVFNFMDGVNGISALSAVVAGGWFVFLGAREDVAGLIPLGAAVTGAALGFLPWNAPRARVFLGDVGSYAFGMAIGSMALVAWADGVSVVLATAPLLVYLADTGWTLAKRVLGGRAWHQAHREHVYQRLVERGLSHLEAGLLVVATSTLLIAAGTAPSLAGVVLMTVVLSAYLALPRLVHQSPAESLQVNGP